MKKLAFIITMVVLTLLVLGQVFANQGSDLTTLNIVALKKTDWGYAQKVILCENVKDHIMLDEQWVYVSFVRTTTVDCTGNGDIPCLKGDVVISDLKIIEE